MTKIEDKYLNYHKDEYGEQWKYDGLLHRDYGPAEIFSAEIGDKGTETWYNHGKIHRNVPTGENPEDFPAITDANGTMSWYKYGELHSYGDHPAVFRPYSGCQRDYEEWYYEGQLNRDGDKPAKLTPYITGYYVHGRLHREKGPAEIAIWGHRFYIYGQFCTKEKHKLRVEHINMLRRKYYDIWLKIFDPNTESGKRVFKRKWKKLFLEMK